MGRLGGRRRPLGWLAGVVLTAALAGGAAAQNAPKGAVDDQRLLTAGKSDADWITFGRDFSNQRYSGLTAINRGNVKRLSVAWIFQTATLGSTQTHPIVVDGVMYFTTPTCDVIAVNAATGEEVWRYRHKFHTEVPRASSNRGVAVAYGRVYEAADDGRVIALDQATGKVVWDKVIPGFDPAGLGYPGKPMPGPIPFVLRAAPLAYDGRIIVGATGFEANDIGDKFVQDGIKAGIDIGQEWIQENLGRRAFLFALDAKTGEETWRWYATKADGWEGDYAETAPDGTPLNRDTKAERAAAARYKNAWAAGSTATWMTPALDPASGLLFVSTGNPAPGSLDLARPGDNLYANGIAALEAKTGKFRWFFQIHPHGIYDATGQAILTDATVNGQPVPALMECGKIGMCFMLDRATGKYLFQSEPVVRVMNLYKPATKEGVAFAPGGPGGVGVSPASYDPTTGYVYVTAIDRPQTATLVTIPAAGGAPELKYVKTQAAPLSEAWGTVTALDMRNKGKIVWQVKTPQPLVGGAVATAGGLVFAGESNGWFDAYDSKTGERLWRFQTGANVGAPPMTYAVDGKQYVAVATGAAAPAVGVAVEPGGLRPGGALVVFALPTE